MTTTFQWLETIKQEGIVYNATGETTDPVAPQDIAAAAKPEEADNAFERLLSRRRLVGPCPPPLLHVADIYIAEEDDWVLFGKCRRLLLKDVTK